MRGKSYIIDIFRTYDIVILLQGVFAPVEGADIHTTYVQIWLQRCTQ